MSTEKVEVNQLLGMGSPEAIDAVPTKVEAPIETPAEPVVELVKEPVTPEPVIEPAKEEPVVETPIVTPKEEKEIEKEEKKEADKQKEEVKEDIKDKSEEYVSSVIENLLEDTTKLRIDSRVIEKERDAYKERREKTSQELNDLKYDPKKIAVRDEYRPLLKVMEEYAQDPKDNNTEIRLLSMYYEQIASITGGDYRADINDFYKRKAQNITKLSNTNSGGFASVPSAGSKPKPKVSGIIRQAGATKRF